MGFDSLNITAIGIVVGAWAQSIVTALATRYAKSHPFLMLPVALAWLAVMLYCMVSVLRAML